MGGKDRCFKLRTGYIELILTGMRSNTETTQYSENTEQRYIGEEKRWVSCGESIIVGKLSLGNWPN